MLVRKAERDMLRIVSPDVDKGKLEDLLQDIADTKYDFSNQVISYIEIQRLQELNSKKWGDSRIPTVLEQLRYSELIHKYDSTEDELKEMKKLALKIQDAKDYGFVKMTDDDKKELEELSQKF